MGSTAKFSISALVSGLPELTTATGGETAGFNSTFSSTNAHYSISVVEVSTNGSTDYMGRGVVVPSSATALYVIPVASSQGSTAIIRYSESTSTSMDGVKLGYRKPSLINVESTVESTVYFKSTAGTTFRVRVVVI